MKQTPRLYATPGRSDKRYKPLCFGVPECPPYQFAGAAKVFHAGEIAWQISSPHEEVSTTLLAGLAQTPRRQIGGTAFDVTEAALLPPPVWQPEMRFIALSPLTAALNDPVQGKVYLREPAALAAAIETNLRWKALVLLGDSAATLPLSFQFDEAYLQRHGGLQSRKISRLIRYGTNQIKAYALPFTVRGAASLLALGWECGFGEANAQGFGLAGLG